jgi:hypothetical protein
MREPALGRLNLWLLYREPASPKSGDVLEETLSEDTVKNILLRGRHFESTPSDAGLEWLFCLASSLQASQRVSNVNAQKSTQAASDSAFHEG